MATRNQILSEWHRRLWEVSSVRAVFRDPKRVPEDVDYPVIAFFVGPDTVTKPGTAGGYPVNIRTMPIRVELYVEAASDESAPEEIEAMLLLVKKEIYRGGEPWLGGKAMKIEEGTTSEPLVPNVLNLMGLGIDFDVTYAEKIADLFA